MNTLNKVVAALLSMSLLLLWGCSGGGGGGDQSSLASNNQIAVVNFVGQTQSAAVAAITAAGLSVGAITPQDSATVPSGTVISQSPSYGASLKSGAVVTLIVSSGPSTGGGQTLKIMTPLPASETTPPSGGLSTTTTASHVVLAWNDLGMHCLNPSYDTAVILPPYNTVRAQVIKRGNKPQVVTAGVTVSYRLINNTTSQKGFFTQFWTYGLQLFGVAPAVDHGLNLDDPAVSNGLAGTMLAKSGYFIASGIPVTPINDGNTWNPYQMIEVIAKDGSTGAILARTRTTIPTSDEINCGKCHGNSTDQSVVFNDILAKHDAHNGTTLLSSKPVLCAQCHGSPALGSSGAGSSGKYLSQAIHGFHSGLATKPACYDCHPGAVTQCNRSTKHTAVDGNCINCHGTLAAVAATIDLGSRVPWVNEPKCVTCHNTGVAQVDTGTTLYRNSMGHGGLFCTACHGSPHAMTPSGQATDNYQSIQYQGKAMALGDCRICHNTSRGGGSAAAFANEHGGANHAACAICHTGFTNASNTANWPHQFQWKSR